MNPSGRPLVPGREDLVLRPAVEGVVHLDRAELPGVGVQPLQARRRFRVEDAHPVVVAPARGPDVDGHGSAPGRLLPASAGERLEEPLERVGLAAGEPGEGLLQRERLRVEPVRRPPSSPAASRPSRRAPPAGRRAGRRGGRGRSAGRRCRPDRPASPCGCRPSPARASPPTVRSASSSAQARASSNPPSRSQGVRTCRPVLPEVFTNDSTPSSSSVALMALATATTSANGRLARVEVEEHEVGPVEVLRPRGPDVEGQRPLVHEVEQRRLVVDQGVVDGLPRSVSSSMRGIQSG